MKTKFLLLFLFVLSVCQAQTQVSVPYPENACLFYDADGNGQMEYFAKSNGKLNKYSYDGTLQTTLLIEDELFGIDDFNRDGLPELITHTGQGTGTDGRIQSLAGEVYYTIPCESFDAALCFDANSDGRTDFFYIRDYNNNYDHNYYICYQQADGSFIEKKIEIVTDEKEINDAMFAQYEANQVIQPPLNFTGASLAKAPKRRVDVVSALQPQNAQKRTAQLAEFNKPIALDINMDGLPDLLNMSNGNALLSLGHNRYYFGTFGGQVTAKDLNGDGIPDFIVYEESTKTVTLYLYEGNNSFKKQQLMQNFNITGVYCYDFDHDGDVDILLPFDYTEASQYSYLVFFENQGNNTFKKRERGSEELMKFLACADFDNDGNFEVAAIRMTAKANYEYSYDYLLIDCLPTFDFEINETPFVSFVKSGKYNVEDAMRDCGNILYGDFNNDGVIEFWLDDVTNKGWSDESHETYKGSFPVSAANTAPDRPKVPTYIYDAANNALRVSWQAGVDRESSACDLTYEVRIGTAPGKGDVWHAHANADGKRRRPGEGNAGYNLYQIIDTKSWSKGKYYISVQTVDAAGLGSAWSEEAVFDKSMLTADFMVSPKRMVTADTLIVTLNTPYDATCNYQWEFSDNARIVGETNTEKKVVYDLAGQEIITLTVTDADGNKASATETVETFGAYWQTINVISDNYIEDRSRKGLAFDADMNGTIDILGTGYKDKEKITGLLQNDGKGNLSKVGRTFNSDLVPSLGDEIMVMDFNMDGLPDFVGKTNKGNVFLNEGSFDFTYSTETFNIENFDMRYFPQGFYTQNTRQDFNGDGLLDSWGVGTGSNYNSTYIYLNQGDNLTFKTVELPREDYSSVIFVGDIDSDGLTDFIRFINMPPYSLSIYNNKGNFQFADPKHISMSDYVSFVMVADMNNDGYRDLVCFRSDGNFEILLGNEQGDFAERFELPYQGDPSAPVSLFDYDNNGYLDLTIIKNGSSTESGIIYFYPGMETRFQAMTEYGGLNMNGNAGLYPDGNNIKFMGDLNGDGTPDMSEYNFLARHKNAAPEAPKNIRAVQNAGSVTLAWDDAVDEETPSVQMRYNISLKRKGASGDNSYILSPMNGGSDKAAAIFGYPYLRATQMNVPIDKFTVGETYEFKVQALDLWNAHSPFSQTYTFTVESKVGIEAPDETCSNSEVVISYVGTESGIPTWNIEDAQVLDKNGKDIIVQWNTIGVKNISVTVNGRTSNRAIHVREGIDMSFTLPAYVLTGAEVPFTLPQVFAEAGRKVGVRTSDKQDVSGSALTFDGVKSSLATPKAIKVERRGTTLEARVTFGEGSADLDGKTWIELYCIDPVCGEIAYRQEVECTADNIVPAISIVTIDPATGKNKIVWKEPANLPDGIFSGMAIYKESGATNNFIKIDEVPVNAEMYIDQQSDPTVRKNRYRIALATEYGGYSTPSAVHSSVHVMLNKGMNNDINIVWTPYEGGMIEQYSIMRGTSPDNMSLLTTASGYESSYSDRTVQDGETYYYALSYSNVYDDNWTQMNAPKRVRGKAAGNQVNGSSNIVSSSQSNVLTFAQSIAILSIEKEKKIVPTQPTLHVYAEIMPAMASYKQVNWSIESGSELVTINQSGLLTYVGGGVNGMVRIKATTIDGSGLSATMDIPVSGFVQEEIIKVTSINVRAENTTLTPGSRTTIVTATVLPANATDKRVTWSVTSGSTVVSVSAEGVVTALGSDGSATIRATANDGSGIYGETTITASGFGSSIDETEAGNISVYPVPAHDVLYINTSSAITRATIISFDGRIIKQSDGNINHMNVTDIPTGLYTLKVELENKVSRIIKILIR